MCSTEKDIPKMNSPVTMSPLRGSGLCYLASYQNALPRLRECGMMRAP